MRRRVARAGQDNLLRPMIKAHGFVRLFLAVWVLLLIWRTGIPEHLYEIVHSALVRAQTTLNRDQHAGLRPQTPNHTRDRH